MTTLRAYDRAGAAERHDWVQRQGRELQRRATGQATNLVQGIGQTQQNNPLISGHPNVVLAVFMDGHTQAITKNTPPPIVKRLSTRDDDQQIGDY